MLWGCSKGTLPLPWRPLRHGHVTLGYKFKPSKNAQNIADGPLIRDYIEETARESGITQHIRFGHKVMSAAWSSADATWTVTAWRSDGATVTLTYNFLMMCLGYYSYDGGYTPEFAGRQSFMGQG